MGSASPRTSIFALALVLVSIAIPASGALTAPVVTQGQASGDPLFAGAAGAPVYHVAFQTTLSGAVALPDACQAHHDELYPQLATYTGASDVITAVYSVDGVSAKASATSTDGGLTWSRSPIPAATACSGGPAERTWTLNPQVSGGPPGQMYFGQSWTNSGDSAQDVIVQRTSDAGATWTDAPSPPGSNSQDIAVVADPTQPGLIHATWINYTPVVETPLLGTVVAATSTDGGQTFSAPVTVHLPLPHETSLGNWLYRDSDGSLLDVFETVSNVNGIAFSANLQPLELTSYATRSTDGGATWSPPVHVGDNAFTYYGTCACYTPGPMDAATGPDGRVAAAWSTLPSNGVGTIELATSSDGGLTWSAPFIAITAPGNAFDPAVSIASNGDLGLFWYDLSDDTPGGDTLADAWFATSRDDGHTWSKMLLAGPFSIEASVEPALWSPNNEYDDQAVLGFYQDVVRVGDGFGVAYTVGPPLANDGRTDVRFARVQPIQPTASRRLRHTTE